MVSEQQIVDALCRVPTEQWRNVLDYVNSLKPSGPDELTEPKPIRTLGDILKLRLVGLWADRTDILDSREFARELRYQASHRKRNENAPGH